MQSAETSSETAAGPHTFKQAKIEHYLQRAEEHLQMARYSTALGTLRTVYQLDPENSAAKSLQKRVEYFVASLVSGKSGSTNGKQQKRRRDELVLIVDQDERVLTSLTSSLRRAVRGLRSLPTVPFLSTAEVKWPFVE